MLHDLLIHDFIHNLKALDGFLLCNSHIGLLQRNWAKATRRQAEFREMRTTAASLVNLKLEM